MAKEKQAPKTIKGMSVAKLKETGVHIINKEIGRQLSAAGRQACLDIGVLLMQLLDVFELYYQEVSHMEINLDVVKSYFAPEVWAKLNTNQRLVLEAACMAQAKSMQASLDRHIKYLEENRRGIERMGPNGQEAVAARLLELQGLGEEVVSE
jgi:hypothetical protein